VKKQGLFGQTEDGKRWRVRMEDDTWQAFVVQGVGRGRRWVVEHPEKRVNATPQEEVTS